MREQVTPLKVEKLRLQAEINCLTFESAIAPENDQQARTQLEAAQSQISEIQAQISPLQWEINQLTRQFWVTKDQVSKNKYDLSASRYRELEQDEAYYESSKTTADRILILEKKMIEEIQELERMLHEI
ncbi:hypothetical protein [Dictyobacter kobayashii]|uniref:Uncharacterized protein n=1 Tax=Dictyobacter kobayashii TaxID=2014872 RepID=A0A402ACD7_9CHLR|nr:hypothetical protein [Dictyobacter kobayashii]GCE16755.1 hypothetical protein KDK_05550 [Dictyobacter kobayashii]